MKTKNILTGMFALFVFSMLILSAPIAFGKEIDKSSPMLYSANNTAELSVSVDKSSPILMPAGANAKVCETDDDCVPEQCCHPTSCINEKYKTACSTACTDSCEGPIDCGAGSCKCVNNNCTVVSIPQTETDCEKNGGMCIYFRDKCPEGYTDSDMTCKTRSEKCCVKKCPEGCACMTEAEANAKFNKNYEKCSENVCGYGYSPTAAAVIKTPEYCFKGKTPPAQCPQGCECLNDAAAKEKELLLCKNESKRCVLTTASGAVQDGHCYEKPVSEACHYNSSIGKCTGVCPDNKVCKRFYIVSKDMVRDEDTSMEYPADSFFDLFVEIDIPDPGANSFFDVFTTEEFVPGKTVCKCVSTKRCQYDAKLDKCTGGCPEGMKCRMFYVVSKIHVKDVDTGELLTPDEAGLSSSEIVAGKKVCKCVPLQVKCRYDVKLDKCTGICPKDMKCRMFYVLSQKEVKDDEGNIMTPEEANISANELVAGMKVCKRVSVVVQQCHYDYAKNACAGECPAGEKCQLNTIYRNATTGEVTYAECQCKAPQVEKCPDNCKCLTRMAGYEQGLDLCSNNITICGYVAPQALANAAPNAMGIPKYCFGEKVYEKCPKSCECLNKEDAYRKGYELCGGVVKECKESGDVPFYCYQKPIDECGKDTLIVTRRINPKEVSPPSFFDVFLAVKPKKNISGVVITEIIPEGMEPAWDYSVVTFDADAEEKIESMPVAYEIIKEIKVKWTSRRPDSWDPKTREAKWIIRDKEGIKPQTFMYKLKLEAAKNDAYKFTGNWLISSGENCSITGDNTVTVKPPGNWPPCQVSDLELLQYIVLWSRGELTDMQILQAIYVWAKKPPCYAEKSIGGDEPWD